MPIFLDSSRPEDIERFHKMGILRGVTTNPTIMVKEGLTGGMAGFEAKIKQIAKIVAPLPVSVEVTNNDRPKMLKQAELFASWAPNVNVKIPIHGPNGELDNVDVIHEIEKRKNIRVNVTAMMSAQQCLLAALAGATYVSIFGGRINNMGYNAVGEIRKLRTVLDQFGLKSQIIVGSTREVLNVIEWLEAGAHIVTTTPDLLKGMLVHPYSKETVQMFVADGAKVEAQLEAAKIARP